MNCLFELNEKIEDIAKYVIIWPSPSKVYRWYTVYDLWRDKIK
jgi:hypothetical protein